MMPRLRIVRYRSNLSCRAADPDGLDVQAAGLRREDIDLWTLKHSSSCCCAGVVDEVGATLNTALVVMGDRLGLYRALTGAGPLSPAELAERTGTAERYIREWLNAQAAGGYVEYDPDSGRYTDHHCACYTRDHGCGCHGRATEMLGGHLRVRHRAVAHRTSCAHRPAQLSL
jgi:hypothetical protein